jgi:cation transport regulator
MPCDKIEDLPARIRNVLPNHEKEIYLSSFNNAYKEYRDKEKRIDLSQNLEAVCAKVAWNAIKQNYHKDSQRNWVEN